MNLRGSGRGMGVVGGREREGGNSANTVVIENSQVKKKILEKKR